MNRKNPVLAQNKSQDAGQAQGGTAVVTTTTPCVLQTGTIDPNCPVQGPAGTIVTTTVVGVGEAAPTHYTFLDTPDANLCVDAFIRVGVVLPDVTVARTLNINSLRYNGLAYTDLPATEMPVMNVIRLNSKYSDVIFQFLNPSGFYCLVYDNASFSNVSIQYRCAAKHTEIEPITHNNVNSTPKMGFLDWLFGGHGGDNMGGTTNSYNSRIAELPCIP